MVNQLRKFFLAPTFDDPQRTQQAAILNSVLWASLVALAIGYFATLVLSTSIEGQLVIFVTVASIIFFKVMLNLGQVTLARRLYLAVLWMAAAGLVLSVGTINRGGLFNFIVIILVAGILGDLSTTIALAALSGLAGGAFYLLEANGILLTTAANFTNNENAAAQLVIQLVGLAFASTSVALATRGMRSALNQTQLNEQRLAETNRDLETNRLALEQRTADLARQTQQLQLAADVGRTAAAARNVYELLPRLVDLIATQVGLYHVGILLADDLRDYLMLRSASSEGGRRLVSQGYRVRISEPGPLSSAFSTSQPVLAQTGSPMGVYLKHPQLPSTMAQVALPLRSAGVVLGVLDLHSAQVEQFAATDLSALQVISDQVAAAIDAALRLEEAQERLRAERQSSLAGAREGWQTLIDETSNVGFRYLRNAIVPVEGNWTSEMVDAIREGVQVEANGYDTPTVALPLRVRGQVIGALRLRKANASQVWTTEELEMLNDLADQISVALDSARLYEATQRRAARERLSAEVTGRMRESLELDQVLQTAVAEMRRILSLEEVEIRMGLEPGTGAPADGEVRS